MKKLIQTLSICAISFTFLLGNSIGGEREKREGKPKEERPQRGKGGDFFKKLDTNGDKAISKEEAGERWARLGKLDKDGDGKVTTKEMMAGRSDGAPKRGDGKGDKKGRPGSGERFKKADKNGDGKLSKDEVPAEAWEKIGKFDKDGDDAVSKKEIEAGFAAAGGSPGKMRDGRGGGSTGGPDAIFAKMDENKDGKLSKDEVPPEMWNRLSNADEDADGNVSKAELEKVYKKRGAYNGGDKPKKKPEGKKKEG